MQGLVDYDSSGDDLTPQPNTKIKAPHERHHVSDEEKKIQEGDGADASNNLRAKPSRVLDSASDSAPIAGPAPGPSAGGLVDSHSPASTAEHGSAPSSPYSQRRQVMHLLTLPPLPVTVIPSSPPRSPTEDLHTISSKKITHFLELKSQGIHFNSKLASSSQLRNPSLFNNLLRFAGLDQGGSQYMNTLEAGCSGFPTAYSASRTDEGDNAWFPKWAYFEELARAQADVGKRNLEKRRQGQVPMEFVPAEADPSALPNKTENDVRRIGIHHERAGGLTDAEHRSTLQAGHKGSVIEDRSSKRRKTEQI